MSRAGTFLAIAAVLMMHAASAVAADVAPLPDGFKPDAAPTVPGLYAHGVAFHDTRDLDQSLRAADRACFAQGRRLKYSGDEASRRMNTQYWLYRSGNDTVVFESSYTVNIDVDLCQVTSVEKRRVSRSTQKAGAWPTPFSGGSGCSRFGKNCYTAQKFDIRQRCRAEGNGFQVTRHCVSIDRGPSRGLLTESVYESDDMSGSGFQVMDLKSQASLDASLFDRSRSW